MLFSKIVIFFYCITIVCDKITILSVLTVRTCLIYLLLHNYHYFKS